MTEASVDPKNSTTVRSKQRRPARAPGWVRGGVGALSRVSPEAAGRAAALLFFRTRRLKDRPEDLEVMARAVPFTLPFEGETIAAWSWGEGPRVLLTHGWNGRASQLAPFVERLVESGRQVVAFDHVGHGDSTGRATNLVSMSRASRAVAEHVGGVAGLVGHSLGAGSALLALAEGLRVERAVLIASPMSPAAWFDGLVHALDLDAPSAAAARRHIEAEVGRTMERLDLRRHVVRVRADVLFIHDRDDREVPIAASEALHYAMPGSRLLVTAGLGHNRILRSPGVHESALRFVVGAELG